MDGRFDGSPGPERTHSQARACVLEALVAQVPLSACHVVLEVAVTDYMAGQSERDLSRVNWHNIGRALWAIPTLQEVIVRLRIANDARQVPVLTPAVIKHVAHGLSPFIKVVGKARLSLRSLLILTSMIDTDRYVTFARV